MGRPSSSLNYRSPTPRTPELLSLLRQETAPSPPSINLPLHQARSHWTTRKLLIDRRRRRRHHTKAFPPTLRHWRQRPAAASEQNNKQLQPTALITRYNQLTMGLLSSVWGGPATPEAKRAEEIRSGAAVPSRAERLRCWESRDKYFGCLDRNNIIDAVEQPGAAAALKACPKENEQFERDCAAQWVSRFFFLSFFFVTLIPMLLFHRIRCNYTDNSCIGRTLQKVPRGQLPEGAAPGCPPRTGRERGADQQRARRLGAGSEEVKAAKQKKKEKKRKEKKKKRKKRKKTCTDGKGDHGSAFLYLFFMEQEAMAKTAHMGWDIIHTPLLKSSHVNMRMHLALVRGTC